MDPDPSSFSSIDFNLILGIAGMLILLICSAFISGTEVAIFSLTSQDIEKINQKSQRKGSLIVSLLEKPKKLLATIVITNTFVNIALIILFFRLGDSLFGAIALPWLSFLLQVIVITFLVLLFGEVVPKLYAGRNNIKFAKKVAFILYGLNKLLSPLSVPMREVTVALHKKIGAQGAGLSIDRLSQALELTD